MTNDDNDTTRSEESEGQTPRRTINRRRFMQVVGLGTVGVSHLSESASAQNTNTVIELKSVAADSGEGQGASEYVWKDGDLSIAEAVAGQDAVGDEIDLQEIQQAVNWWGTESEVPDTDGQTIDTQTISDLIGTWKSGSTIDIGDLTNPTLSLIAGEDYTVEWTNADGHTHDFVIVDSDGNEIINSNTLTQQGATQAVSFTATVEMAEYYCTHHPDSQRGTVEVGTQPAFSVSGLDPTSLSADVGDTVSVSVTVTNTGTASGTQTVAFQVGDETVTTQNVTLGPSDQTTVSFEDVSLDSFSAGEYTYGVYAGDSNQTGTLTLTSPKPNVVVIMADDMGYGDTSVPPFTSDPAIPTPNLETMAANGATFTSHYNGAPVCTPTRGALLTGCYPPRVGLNANNVYFPGASNGLHPDETTIAEVLREQGYATGMVGKWHLGDADPFLPPNQGFDTYFGVPYSNDMNPFPLLEGVETVQDTAPNDQLTQLYTDRATQFIQDHQDEPFFLYVPHTMPHVPLGVSDQFDGATGQGTYADVIHELDWSVGQILDQLEQSGIAEDTLVVFTSDDGPWLSYGDNAGSNGPLRGGKMSTWEGGARAPTIVQMPGTVSAGATCDEMTSHLDFLPTVANLAGAEMPDVTIDGKGITGLLSDPEGGTSPHDYYMYYDGGLQAIRDAAGWKYHFGSGELYDLSTDIDESDDVSGANPEVVDRLKQYGNSFDSDLQTNARPEGSLSSIARVSVGSAATDGTTAVTFTNERDAQVTDVTVSTSSPDDGITVETQPTATFASVDPGSSVTVDVQLTTSGDSAPSELFVLGEATYVADGEQRTTVAGEHVSFVSLNPVPDQYSTFNNGSDDPLFGAKDDGSLVVEGTGMVFGDTDEYTTIYLDDGLPSNGTAVMKVTSIDQTTEYSTGDLVVRNDITKPGESPGYVSVSVNKQNAQIKIDANGDGNIQKSELSDFDGSGLPKWVRIERSGSSYVASYSADGSSWTQIASFDLPDAASVQDVGVAVTSSTDENARVEFGEFEVTGSSSLNPLSSEYATFNNGSDDPTYGELNGTLYIEGTGKSADGIDEYTAFYLDDAFTDGATAVAKITSVELVSQYSTAGFIVRNDVTGAGSSLGYAQIGVNENTLDSKFDENANGYLDDGGITQSMNGLPVWLRLVRSGTTYTLSYSADGSTWTEFQTFTLENASAAQDIGIAVTAPATENTTAKIGSFKVTNG